MSCYITQIIPYTVKYINYELEFWYKQCFKTVIEFLTVITEISYNDDLLKFCSFRKSWKNFGIVLKHSVFTTAVNVIHLIVF